MISTDKLPKISIGKYLIKGTNRQELLGIKKEIIDESIYYVDITNSNPRILDIGAHVGLATLYFKRTWPDSIVTCIEPHPVNFQILNENIWFNQLKDVDAIETAVSSKEGIKDLYFDATADDWYSTAGFISGAWNHQQQSRSVKVKTILLDSLIKHPVDLLKIDIEGAEVEVVDAARRLKLVKNIIVELHPENHRKTSPLIEILQKQHFEVSVAKTHFGLSRLYAYQKSS